MSVIEREREREREFVVVSSHEENNDSVPVLTTVNELVAPLTDPPTDWW